jgi:hypothetical protein
VRSDNSHPARPAKRMLALRCRFAVNVELHGHSGDDPSQEMSTCQVD